MLLTVEEMELLCVAYQGTVSSTLELLRTIKGRPPVRMTVVMSLIEKLSGLKNGETVSITFEPEEK